MACTITQDDLGPQFAAVDAEIAALFIEIATEIVLGPVECQAAKYLAWVTCCVSPCLAIKLLAQHLISSDPFNGAEGADVTSETVGDVSTSYGNATSTSGLYGSTVFGRMFSGLLAKFEVCRSRRQFTGIAVLGGCGC
jgi:hypothetical protein